MVLMQKRRGYKLVRQVQEGIEVYEHFSGKNPNRKGGKAFLDHLLPRLNPKNINGGPSMPFELEVVEAALLSRIQRLERRLMDVEPRVINCFNSVDINLVLFFVVVWKVELGSRAGALKQMLLDLLEDPHEIRRICIMGRNCTLSKGNNDMECSVPLEKQIAEEEEEEIEMLLENYLQRCESCHGHAERLLDSAREMEDSIAVNLSSRRLEVSRVELLLQVGTFCLAMGALVAGIFGMNLKSYLEELVVCPPKYVFVSYVACVLYVCAVCILADNSWDNRRFCCHILSYVLLSQGKEDIMILQDNSKNFRTINHLSGKYVVSDAVTCALYHTPLQVCNNLIQSLSMSFGASTLFSFKPSLHPHHYSSSRFSYVQKHTKHRPFFHFQNLVTASFPDSLCSTSSFKPLCAMEAGHGALLQDAVAAALVSGGAYVLVRLFDSLTEQKLIKQRVFTGVAGELVCTKACGSVEFEQKNRPYFIRIAFHAFLANFQSSASTGARYFAAFVPLLNCVRLIVNGLSLVTDEGLVKSVTREGNPKELLGGPLYYVLILISSAILFWRDSPVGVISLAMMCGGDGFADIMGRKYGSLKIPYNPQKSFAGSISMFLCGFLISIMMLYYFSALGYFQLDWTTAVQRVALVALVATIVESLPTTEVVDDNISVPISSMLIAFMFFS
ncbi:hypothetical protein IFM89_012911 [Coptis chinensis]|uniref:Phytol kinase n=1 Tax=Coptis chinensis TaxID=261450 RepID=A0A835HE63_9MAGN|nr:hypothetical protein IFM89_012911 [Coptis chinensis]